MNSAYPQRHPRLQNNAKGMSNGLTNASGGWGGNAGGTLGYGGGGLGGALPRPSQLSGFAQIMGGGQGQIDMSDFPSLGGATRPPTNHPATQVNYNTVRQNLGQQTQQTQQHGHLRAANMDGQVDSSSKSASTRQGHADDATAAGRHPTHASPQTTIPIRDAISNANGADRTAPNPPIKRYADMTDREKYGMAGLTAAFAAREQREAGNIADIDQTLPAFYRSAMFPGVSLESLNMEDLASSDPILPTFHIYGAPQSAANPFDYTSRNTIPDYTLPNAYRVGNVPSIEARMDALSDETLFFIFFSQPRDVAQQRAAGELERREWRWHTVLRQWMRSDSPPGQSATATGPNLALVDMAPTIPAGAPRIPIDNTTEQGIFIFFDLQQWKRVRREFKLNINDIDGKTMPRGPLSSLAANGVAYIRSQPGHGT